MEKDMAHISAVRTAATWMRRSSSPLERYPKLSTLTSAQRTEALQFASGILPWPSRWTVKLYSLATAG